MKFLSVPGPLIAPPNDDIVLFYPFATVYVQVLHPPSAQPTDSTVGTIDTDCTPTVPTVPTES